MSLSDKIRCDTLRFLLWQAAMLTLSTDGTDKKSHVTPKHTHRL